MAFNVILSSNHGGWQFNSYYDSDIFGDHMDPPTSNAIQSSELITNAFFNFGSPSTSLFPYNNDLALELNGPSSGLYALSNRNTILSDAIPCLTLPVGANPVSRLAPPGQPDRNTDMQTLENGWPAERFEKIEGNNWHHSDNRAVAYTFTHRLFDQIVTSGNLQ